MTSTSSDVPDGIAGTAQLLQRVRARVESELRSGTPTARTVTAPTPLRPLPSDVQTTLDARTAERLAPLGTDHPREAVRKIGGVAAAVGALGLVILVLGLVTGDAGLIAIGAAELVIFGGGAVGIYRYARTDPLRVSAAQRKIVEDCCRWTPTSGEPLVAVATVAAQRIVDSPAWRSGSLAEAGVLVSLGPELDAIAAAGPAATSRVAALVAYADCVEGLRGGIAELDAARVEVLAFLLSDAIRSGS